jgi:hypothetical protein
MRQLAMRRKLPEMPRQSWPLESDTVAQVAAVGLYGANDQRTARSRQSGRECRHCAIWARWINQTGKSGSRNARAEGQSVSSLTLPLPPLIIFGSIRT